MTTFLQQHKLITELDSDCMYQVLRSVGLLHMAACAVVCKQWKSIIFRARIPIVVHKPIGVHYEPVKGCTLFVAFVRNRRGYVRCIILKKPISNTVCFTVCRGKSRPACIVDKSFIPIGPSFTHGEYRMVPRYFSKLRSEWPDYDELAAVLGAADEFKA